MSAHLLDQAIWHALNTRQADLAIGGAHARRFDPAYGPLAAMVDDGPQAWAQLRELAAAHGPVVLFGPAAIAPPPGFACLKAAEIVQFSAERLIAPAHQHSLQALTDADAAEMLALATLTEPGPFAAQTHQLGPFLGVKQDGRLAAMAGTRMRPPGHTEVSAVCTHPDFRGQGLAAALCHAAGQAIIDAGETPFLQAYADNRAALALYERLGFTVRARMWVTALAAN